MTRRACPDQPKTGTPEAKTRRAARVDLSGLTNAQRQARADLIEMGVAAYGPTWQTTLASALTFKRGVTVKPQQVASWVSGARPVPQAVLDVLPDLAARMAIELAFRAETLRLWPGTPVPPSVEQPPPPQTVDEIVSELFGED